MLKSIVPNQYIPHFNLFSCLFYCAGALDELHISEFASCRENAAPSTEASAAPIAPTPPPRRRKPNRKCVESAAAELVDEVIARAQQRVRRSAQTSACDNEFQLPVTQAVTKWLHEHGGLPAVRELAGADQRHALSDEDESSDEEEAAQLRPKNVDEVKMAVTVSRAKTQKKLKQNCVICWRRLHILPTAPRQRRTLAEALPQIVRNFKKESKAEYKRESRAKE